MNTIGKYLLLFGLICMLATGCAGQRVDSRPITQIVGFGDSLSDSGRTQQLTMKDIETGASQGIVLPPVETYWQGRFSNGPVMVEVLAEKLNLELTNYSVGGAMSNEYNGMKLPGEMVETGLLGQLKSYQKDLGEKKADPDALYYIQFGGNDWEALSIDLYGEMKAEVADVTIANIETAISELAAMGATRFFVVNSPDTTAQPDTIARSIVKEGQVYQDRFNKDLPGKMSALSKKLGVEIVVFDIKAVEEKIRSDPGKYGLTNLSEPCLNNMLSTDICSDPDAHYWWDPYHPTQTVHKIFGEAMAAVYGK